MPGGRGPVFSVEALVGKNRLVIRLWGVVTEEEALQIGDASLRALERLRPGFDILSDLTGVTELPESGSGQIERVVEAARVRGFRRVVRVVGRSAMAAVRFQRSSRNVGHEAYLAFSLEEAEQLLEGGLT
ncbi:hypothetical protein HNV28_37325 [Myxococcus xanthus]|uniref:STAS domain-containing protein n=1 Tax=Myxococcus xanthus TaxID=34 RepID=A0A7Y4MV58_MYXXA|nr:hypothetical protein [Myxococcus xanthus]NOJ83906.1 hypothetical protein [Myxococcus xanthus]NOJ90834.1 hypothetical protein [Myxococcus xanthus]